MKRLLCIVLSIIAAVSLQLPVFADSDSEYGDFRYRLCDSDGDGENDSVKITGCKSDVIKAVIPDEIDGLPVTELGNVIFMDCRRLKYVYIPETVNYINFPVNTEDGNGSLSDCNSIFQIEVSEENQFFSSINGVLFNKDKTTLLFYPGGKPLSCYKVPDSVEIIYGDSFTGTRRLKKLILGENTKKIGKYAFGYCTTLKCVVFSDSLKEIDSVAFKSCTSLMSADIPESVENIGLSAFYRCDSLQKITINNPSCEIAVIGSYGMNTISETAVIYGYTDSTAQEYAEEYDRIFIPVEKP